MLVFAALMTATNGAALSSGCTARTSGFERGERGSQAGAAGLFDKILCYDYGLNRASTIQQSGSYLATLSRPGLTLEGLDSVSGSVDALTFSLDDVALAALPKLSLFEAA